MGGMENNSPFNHEVVVARRIRSWHLDMKVAIRILPPPVRFSTWQSSVGGGPFLGDDVRSCFINKGSRRIKGRCGLRQRLRVCKLSNRRKRLRNWRCFWHYGYFTLLNCGLKWFRIALFFIGILYDHPEFLSQIHQTLSQMDRVPHRKRAFKSRHKDWKPFSSKGCHRFRKPQSQAGPSFWQVIAIILA